MNIVVLITAGDQAEARSMASALVQEKLAACVNIVPGVESIYYWEGNICSDEEFLLVVKTRKALFPQLEERVREMHTYDVPEIIALPIEEGSQDYFNWLAKSTGEKRVS